VNSNRKLRRKRFDPVETRRSKQWQKRLHSGVAGKTLSTSQKMRGNRLEHRKKKTQGEREREREEATTKVEKGR
jgi:hypothetical protein